MDGQYALKGGEKQALVEVSSYNGREWGHCLRSLMTALDQLDCPFEIGSQKRVSQRYPAVLTCR